MMVGGDKEEGWIKFKKMGVDNIGGLHKIMRVRNPLPTMSHKNCSGKRMF